jgi:hypothetical protein
MLISCITEKSPYDEKESRTDKQKEFNFLLPSLTFILLHRYLITEPWQPLFSFVDTSIVRVRQTYQQVQPV